MSLTPPTVRNNADTDFLHRDSRVGSDLINQFFKSRLPADCVERNSTEGGVSLSPGEVKQLDGIKKRKGEPTDKAKGPKNAVKKSPSPVSAGGSSPTLNFGGDGPAPEPHVSATPSSVSSTGQEPQDGPRVLGAPAAQTPGFTPQITLTSPSDGSTTTDGSSPQNSPTKGNPTTDIPIPRGLAPAEVLDRYQSLSNLTGPAREDFEAAIEAIRDEAAAYASIRPTDNNGEEKNGRRTEGANEVNGSPIRF